MSGLVTPKITGKYELCTSCGNTREHTTMSDDGRVETHPCLACVNPPFPNRNNPTAGFTMDQMIQEIDRQFPRKEASMSSEGKTTLVSLVQQAQSIESAILESGGELTPEIEALLNAVDVSMADKLDGYHHIIEQFDAQAAFFKAQADEYLKAAKGLSAFQERLKIRIKEAMIQMGKDEAAGSKVRFKLTNTAPRLSINEALLDKAYLITVTTTLPDKERIKEALQLGAKIEGASLEGGKALRTYLNKKVG